LDRFTGFKSSPYTEGALFYGEKPAAQEAEDASKARLDRLEEPKETQCPPERSG
jgi:hypothetical protein